MDSQEQAMMLGQAFIAALVGSINASATLMHGLVAKGVLTSAEAHALLSDARDNSLKMSLPDVFTNGIRSTYAQIMSGFET